MDVKPGNAQWIGQRGEQQDAFGFTGFDRPYFQVHAGVLAVLADGMGGMSNGREASRLAVQAMLSAYRDKRPDESIPDALMRGLTAANRAVYELAQASDGEGSMGTTLVAAAVCGEHLFWVAAGDSRLYLYRATDGSLTQCTQDHNYGNELLLRVAAGELSRESVEGHPDRDALTSFLGLAEVPKVDCNLRPLPLAAGDRLLLCSDGIHGVLSEVELKRALAAEAQPAADALIAAVKAKALDAQDNATAAVLVCHAMAAAKDAHGGSRAKRRVSRVLVLSALAIALGLGVGIGLGPTLRLLGVGQPPDVVPPETAPEPDTGPSGTEAPAPPEPESEPPADAGAEAAQRGGEGAKEPDSSPEAETEGPMQPAAPQGTPSTTASEGTNTAAGLPREGHVPEER